MSCFQYILKRNIHDSNFIEGNYATIHSTILLSHVHTLYNTRKKKFPGSSLLFIRQYIMLQTDYRQIIDRLHA